MSDLACGARNSVAIAGMRGIASAADGRAADCLIGHDRYSVNRRKFDIDGSHGDESVLRHDRRTGLDRQHKLEVVDTVKSTAWVVDLSQRPGHSPAL